MQKDTSLLEPNEALPSLVSSLLACDMLHAEDNVHAHVLLICSLCVPWAANRKGQLLGWHTQQLQTTRSLPSMQHQKSSQATDILQTQYANRTIRAVHHTQHVKYTSQARDWPRMVLSQATSTR